MVVGDKVVCISNIIHDDVYDDHTEFKELTIGKTYIIKEILTIYYLITSDNKYLTKYYQKSLFITMSELRDKKLKILLDENE